MRHIIHTCLMAIRLMASANSVEKEGNLINRWYMSITNETLSVQYVDTGTNLKAKSYYISPRVVSTSGKA